MKSKLMEADGNCLFRSISDQLYGNDSQHLKLRSEILEFMVSHTAHFELFWDDEEDSTFETYITRMRGSGTWAGNQELFAACESLNCDITVHVCPLQEGGKHSHGHKGGGGKKGKNKQAYEPPPAPVADNDPLFSYVLRPGLLTTATTASTTRRSIHISYHGECHYNSVRCIDDPDEGNPAVMFHRGSEADRKGAAKTDCNDKGKVQAAKYANEDSGDGGSVYDTALKIVSPDSEADADACLCATYPEYKERAEQGPEPMQELTYKEKKKELFLQRKADAAASGMSKKELKRANKLAKRIDNLAITAVAASITNSDSATITSSSAERIVISI